MKLARYRTDDTYVGVVHDGLISPVGRGSGRAGQELLLDLAVDRSGREPDAIGDEVALSSVDLLSPVPEPPSIRDFYAFEAHVATARRTRGLEMEPDWYELPVFYFSNPAVVLGSGEPVVPPGTAELDYELEVAAVMGRSCIDVVADDWLDVVAGFTIMNDWSARDLQRREMKLGLGPAKGKDFATSLGPILVTPDELPGIATGRPRARMAARVNGVEWSSGELADIHFTWGELIAYAARSARLRPGDVIGSGTVGTGCILELALVHGGDRYPWLQPGDEVELEVQGIGVLANRIAGSGASDLAAGEGEEAIGR